MKVLVADDEAEIRHLCRVNPEFSGYEVAEAGSGTEALEVLRHERPESVFLDLVLPDVDGWEVLAAIRSDPSSADVPVVLLTARAGEEGQIRGWEEGIFDDIVKPFNPLILAEWVEQAFDPADEGFAERRRRRRLEQLRFLRNLR